MILFSTTGRNFPVPLEIKEYKEYFILEINKQLALLGKNDFEINSCPPYNLIYSGRQLNN